MEFDYMAMLMIGIIIIVGVLIYHVGVEVGRQIEQIGQRGE